MAEVNVVINGRTYNISCDEGQQQRVLDLGHYVDQKIKDIARSGAATNENHLLVLASLILADEVYDLMSNAEAQQAPQAQAQPAAESKTNGSAQKAEEDAVIVGAIKQLASRIDNVAGRLQKATA